MSKNVFSLQELVQVKTATSVVDPETLKLPKMIKDEVKKYHDVNDISLMTSCIAVVELISKYFPRCQKCRAATHSECRISFRNWFWHLIVANRSIMLNFYQKRPVFALKKSSKATKDKKASKVQNLKTLISSIFKVYSSINVSVILKKGVLKKIGNFHLHYITFLK